MRPLFLLFVCLSITSTAHAWTPAAEQRIASKAATLAPPDLKLLIDKYSIEYQQGVRDAAEDNESRHTYIVSSKRGALRGAINDEVKSAVRIVKDRKSLGDFVGKLGRISHLVGDANNPFHVADGDRRLVANQTDFEQYFERRMHKFPTVFYGLKESNTLEGYLDVTLQRTATWYPLLAEEYFRHGVQRSSADFDDRSTAFGVAALAYSHTVSDLVNIYYLIWKEAGGDVRSAAAMRKGNLFLNQSYE
jgi:hypothetical protein